MKRRAFLSGLFASAGAQVFAKATYAQGRPQAPTAEQVKVALQQANQTAMKIEKMELPKAEWKKRLSSAQFAVLRDESTERAFSSNLNDEKRKGVFHCAGCDLELFTSEAKFDSGTGWPSFFQPLKKTSVAEKRDPDGSRVEILCSRCLGHLGHLFDDANGSFGIPKTPTGLRYCMNSGAMKFIPKSTGH